MIKQEKPEVFIFQIQNSKINILYLILLSTPQFQVTKEVPQPELEGSWHQSTQVLRLQEVIILQATNKRHLALSDWVGYDLEQKA